ncbi:hypothetical protein OPQ81_004137 [Rhizoctonia solani]|nr:hypothetical protein OPQ81_004137 [Rhizoctonia solani]
MPPAAAPKGPLAGHFGHLTPEQEQTLSQLKTELQAEGWFVPERHDDRTLLRFLRARKFDPANSKKMIIDCETWRKDFKVDDIVNNSDYTKNPEKQLYPRFYHKTDKDGRPVYIERIGLLQVDALDKKDEKDDKTMEQQQLENLVLEYERFLYERLPACSAAVGKPVETSCTILDLKDASLGNFYKVSGYIQKASKIGQDYYPETMGKFYIVNAPLLFRGVWFAVKGWLDAVTVEKITILGGESQYVPKLLEQIPAENLPSYLGGTCNCPGGCSEADPGPWNDPKLLLPHRCPLPRSLFPLDLLMNLVDVSCLVDYE